MYELPERLNVTPNTHNSSMWVKQGVGPYNVGIKYKHVVLPYCAIFTSFVELTFI